MLKIIIRGSLQLTGQSEVCHTDCMAEWSQYTKCYRICESRLMKRSQVWETKPQKYGTEHWPMQSFGTKNTASCLKIKYVHINTYFSSITQKKVTRSLVKITGKYGRPEFPSKFTLWIVYQLLLIAFHSIPCFMHEQDQSLCSTYSIECDGSTLKQNVFLVNKWVGMIGLRALPDPSYLGDVGTENNR